jgi:hypothetical protein
MTGKYDRLTAALTASGVDRIVYSFGDVERIIGAPLPLSARRHRAWWGNNDDISHVQSQAWRGAGWRVAGIDLARERVTFARVASSRE